MEAMQEPKRQKKNKKLIPRIASAGTLVSRRIAPFPMLLAGLALGAAAMFLLDPQQGNGRRAKIGQKGVRLKNQAYRQGRKIFRNLKNRAMGVKARLLPLHSDADVDDQTLHERLRSKLGRKINHLGGIRIEVDRGEVTLSGPALSREINLLMESVRAVPGVKRVINDLEEHDSAGNTPGLQGDEHEFLH